MLPLLRPAATLRRAFSTSIVGLSKRATALVHAGDVSAAVDHLQLALDTCGTSSDSIDTLIVTSHLGHALSTVGRDAEAEPHHRRTLEEIDALMECNSDALEAALATSLLLSASNRAPRNSLRWFTLTHLITADSG